MDVDLAGAIRLNYWLNLGLTAKYISKNLSGVSASTFAIDLGLLYFTPIPHLRAGLDIQNTENEVEVDMEISFQELGQLCSLDEEKTRTAIEKMVKAKVLRIQSNNQIVGINLVNLEKYIKYLEMKEQFDN